jgi:hypothetical protein
MPCQSGSRDAIRGQESQAKTNGSGLQLQEVSIAMGKRVGGMGVFFSFQLPVEMPLSSQPHPTRNLA